MYTEPSRPGAWLRLLGGRLIRGPHGASTRLLLHPRQRGSDPLPLEVWPSLGVLGSAKRKPGTAIRWADKIELKNRALSRRKVFVINNLGIRNILK